MAATAVSSPLEGISNTIAELGEEVKLQKDTRTADLIFGSVSHYHALKIVLVPFALENMYFIKKIGDI